MEEKEHNNIYAIPANYTDSGKLFGGLLETRNTVEAAILVFLVGYPELMWLSVPGTIKIVVMTITLLPLGIFALLGINGDSLMQYVFHIAMSWIRRRKLHYRRIGYHYDEAKYKIKGKKGPKKKKSGNNRIRTGLHSNQRHKKRHR